TESTNITLHTRVSNDSVTFSEWSSSYNNAIGSNLTATPARYIQYQSLFFTPDKYMTPYLENVTINYTDVNAPVINFTIPTPKNNSVLKQDYIYINTSITDEHSILSCTLEFNSVNQTMSLIRDGRNATCFTNKTSLSDGSYGFVVYANDSFGNLGSSEARNVSIDFGAPVVSITSINPNPANYTFNNVSINFTASDAHLNESFVNVSFPNGTLLAVYLENFTLTPTNLSVPGNYTLVAFANDTVGNFQTDTDYLIVNDITVPNATLLSPTNNSYNNTNSIIFYYIPKDDFNVSNCSLIINNKINMSNLTIEEAIPNNFTLSSIADDAYNWSVNCTDNYNNINGSETRIFTIDTLRPKVVFSVPTESNDTFFNRNYIFVNVSVNETNFKNATFYLYNSSFDLVNETNVTSGTNVLNLSINFSNLADLNEKYYYNVTVRDLANNENSTETRVITLDSLNPNINFSGGTEANNTLFNRNWIFVNVTTFDNNSANLTFFLYNSSFDLINRTTYTAFSGTNSSINFTNLADINERYYYNATATDKAGNRNSTE
ncbi:MAG: hypothetical protein AABX32_03135, partial [Nanoarchaeota archaeon]